MIAPTEAINVLVKDQPWHHLPLLTTTRLILPVLLEYDPFDLRRVTYLLAKDPMAVLQASRLCFGYSGSDSRPERLEDLVAMLSREDLLSLAHGDSSSGALTNVELRRFAQHAFSIGQMCRETAGALGCQPEMAFLVGLLHEAGSLPGLFVGRQVDSKRPSIDVACVVAVSEHFHLPAYVQQALLDVARPVSSPWRALLAAAHELDASHAQPLPAFQARSRSTAF